MQPEINYLAVLGAGVVSMLVGFAWYSPALFGKPWMKLMGHTAEGMKKAQKGMGMMYALSFVASLITAYILSHAMVFSQNYYQTPLLTAALSTGFFMWLGFVAPVQMTDVIFGGKKWSLFGINTGYQLVSLLIMAVVLAIWV